MQSGPGLAGWLIPMLVAATAAAPALGAPASLLAGTPYAPTNLALAEEDASDLDDLVATNRADARLLADRSSAHHADSKRKGAASSPFAIEDPMFFEANEPRSDLVAPILTFLLPGADQWYLGQTEWAFWYTGLAASGLFYAGATQASNNMAYAQQQEQEKYAKAGKTYNPNDLNQKDIAVRKVTLGELVYQGAGGMSAYHAFRSAVRTRKGQGQYDFLSHEESPLDIYLSPFHFSYLARPTTYIPLLVGGALLWAQMKFPDSNYQRDTFRSSDAFFSGAYSYNAGTHEEAVFRGWLMPVMREYWGSDFWSNTAQSVLFAAAHLNTNPQPIPQLLLGWDLGWTAQRNDWQIGEGVFIHAWWDVLAFVGEYEYTLKDPSQQSAFRMKPVLWLPPFQMLF